MRPNDVLYTRSHEWVRKEGGQAVFGITDFAVTELRDLVHVELPQVGDQVEVDVAFGEIESVKTVADLVAPVSGEILEVNEEVAGDPDLVAKDPFNAGWLVRVRMTNPEELDRLIPRSDYEEFLETGAGEDDQEEDLTDESA